MGNLCRGIGEFIRSEDGPTSVEYAVMLALILLTAFAAIGSLGNKVTAIFSGMDNKMTAPT
jgi:pilus assembly protein Flp/PilA